jgi:hypothetical protein
MTHYIYFKTCTKRQDILMWSNGNVGSPDRQRIVFTSWNIL